MSAPDSWEEVALLRKSAEHYARHEDTFAAAMQDAAASAMAERLRAKEAEAKKEQQS